MALKAILLVCVFTVPAMADANWDFYGSARMATFRENEDLADNKDQSITDWYLQGNSRIGARVKVNDNGIGGRFEYGTGVNLRLLYGTWNFGPGTIFVGQRETPTTFWPSNQVWYVDNDLIGAGDPWDGRQPQLALQFGNFEAALIKPNTVIPAGYTAAEPKVESVTVNGVAYNVVVQEPEQRGSVETTFPKIAANYKFKSDIFYINGFAGYNSFIIESKFGRDETFSSGLIGANFGVTPGPFYFKSTIYYAMNPLEYGLYDLRSGVSVNVTMDGAGNTTVDDVKSWGALGVVGFAVNDMLTLEAGWGMTEYELDVSGANSSVDMSYYANATINLAPGFFVVPEIGMVDGEDKASNDNDLFYFGAKWQINF
jgi:hypothetical protein